MLATRPLPPAYVEWNRRWHAPHGRRIRGEGRLPQQWRDDAGQRWPKLRGPFGFQPNNQTREFEYPWVYETIGPRPGLRALDIGGSNSGMQFVLSKQGVAVTNVDPGEEARGVGWPVTSSSIAALNQAFGTDVRFIGSTVQQAGLAAESFDVAYSISTIEHIPLDELPSLMAEVARVLVPGGRFVLTIDLFLNLAPFGLEDSNEWGTNVDVAELVRWSGLDLIEGDPAELHGYPEFSVPAVLSRLDRISFGGYPAAAQCLVLRKPDAA